MRRELFYELLCVANKDASRLRQPPVRRSRSLNFYDASEIVIIIPQVISVRTVLFRGIYISPFDVTRSLITITMSYLEIFCRDICDKIFSCTR